MTAAAKCNRPHCGASPRVDAVRKAEARGQGESFSLLKWRPTSSRKAGILSRDDGGLKRRLAPSSMQTARARDQPLRTMWGLGVLCPLGSFTIEHGSEHRAEVTMTTTGLIDSGAAWRHQPESTRKFDTESMKAVA